MAYNYSEYFLLDNKEVLQWLVELAREGTWGSKRFAAPHEAREYRYKISNLLATLAYHQPDLAWVKNRSRTWVERDQGWFVVNVGVPPAGKKLRGPRPIAIEVGSTAASPHIPDEPLVIEEITGRKELMQLGTLIVSEDHPVKEAIIRTPPPPEGIEYLRNVLNEVSGLGFEILSTSPTLRLRVVKRTNASANVASETL